MKTNLNPNLLLESDGLHWAEGRGHPGQSVRANTYTVYTHTVYRETHSALWSVHSLREETHTDKDEMQMFFCLSLHVVTFIQSKLVRLYYYTSEKPAPGSPVAIRLLW